MDFFVEHFQQGLILALLLALFFKESLTAFINAKLGVKERVPGWGQRLVQYANHDTTERLNKLIEMEEKEHEQQDTTRDLIREGNGILREIKEYGVRIRKD